MFREDKAERVGCDYSMAASWIADLSTLQLRSIERLKATVALIPGTLGRPESWLYLKKLTKTIMLILNRDWGLQKSRRIA